MLKRLFGIGRQGADLLDLWRAIVAEARQPHWYADEGVADTLEGRFDMVSAVTALVLLRFEKEDARAENARLTEIFIDDMQGQLRESGVGDLMVGKRMGKLVAALGGRVGAYRESLSGDEAALAEAARRNVTFRDEDSDARAFALRLRELAGRIDGTPFKDLKSGAIGA